MLGLGGAARGRIRRGPAPLAALAVACVTLASVAVAGCSGFAMPPKKKPHPTYASNPAAVRIADAPALLVQCAIRTATGLAARVGCGRGFGGIANVQPARATAAIATAAAAVATGPSLPPECLPRISPSRSRLPTSSGYRSVA